MNYYDCCIWNRNSPRWMGMNFTERRKREAIASVKRLLKIRPRAGLRGEVRARPRDQVGSVHTFKKLPVVVYRSWEATK